MPDKSVGGGQNDVKISVVVNVGEAVLVVRALDEEQGMRLKLGRGIKCFRANTGDPARTRDRSLPQHPSRRRRPSQRLIA